MLLPSRATNLIGAQLGVPATATVAVEVISTTANSESGIVNAEAEVAGARLSALLVDAVIGGSILDTETSVIRPSADCGPGTYSPTAFGDAGDLRIARDPVTLDLSGEADVAITALGVPVRRVSLRTDAPVISFELQYLGQV